MRPKETALSFISQWEYECSTFNLAPAKTPKFLILYPKTEAMFPLNTDRCSNTDEINSASTTVAKFLYRIAVYISLMLILNDLNTYGYCNACVTFLNHHTYDVQMPVTRNCVIIGFNFYADILIITH